MCYVTFTPFVHVWFCPTDCQIRQIGTPLFHRQASETYGMWMKDSKPHEMLGEKWWLTKHISRNTLYYYDSEENLKRDRPDGEFNLTEHYFGTGNVVYNGSFYYHRMGYRQIVKFDLVKNESMAKLELPSAAFQASINVFVYYVKLT